MGTDDVTTSIKDAFSAGLVFAAPYERSGIGVIPGARVSGGAAGGHGSQEGQEGEGGVLRLSGRPVGAFVVSDDRVRWRPAVDVNRLVAVLGAVLVALIVARAAVERARLSRSGARTQDIAEEPDVESFAPDDEPAGLPST